MMGDRGRSKTPALVAALASTIPALVVIELLCRAFAPQPLALSYRTPLGLTLHIPDATIRYARSEFDHPISINSLGLRGPEVTLPKPPGSFRILILGDSFTEGKQVSFEETFARQLEGRLAAALPDRQWEVVNAGVSGYGTADEIKFFEAYGHDLGADLVILGFFIGNDVMNNALSPFFAWKNGELVENPVRPLSRAQIMRSRTAEFLTSHFHFVQFLRDRLRELHGSRRPAEENEPTVADDSENASDPRDANGWAFSDALVGRLRGLVAESGAGFLLVAIPTRLQVDIAQRDPEKGPIGAEVDWPQRLLAAFARSERVPFLDLLPALRDGARTAPAYYQIDAHFNARGHSIAADEIFRSLTSEGLLYKAAGSGVKARLSLDHRP